MSWKIYTFPGLCCGYQFNKIGMGIWRLWYNYSIVDIWKTGDLWLLKYGQIREMDYLRLLKSMDPLNHQDSQAGLFLKLNSNPSYFPHHDLADLSEKERIMCPATHMKRNPGASSCQSMVSSPSNPGELHKIRITAQKSLFFSKMLVNFLFPSTAALF